ncbi:MAG: Ig-like domain-containing protein, partial [Gemmatimonas sp.]|uniref:Ig-like domain-containing protein n=1 Tax=Gemmatimonas sp. TaxID=1962908 RepID=UPI00391F47B2
MHAVSISQRLRHARWRRRRTSFARWPAGEWGSVWWQLCLLVLLGACDGAPTESAPRDGRVASLLVSPASLNLPAGVTQPLQLEARDAAGVLVDAPAVDWRSDAPAVASVDATGVVRAVAPGSARITANVRGVNGPLSALVTVSVTADAPDIVSWRTARAGLSDVTLLGAWDDGAGTTYAVGQNGGVLRSRNDGPWEVVPVGTTETIVGIWGSSPTDIWMVGTNGLVLRGNGTTFAPVPTGSTNT